MSGRSDSFAAGLRSALAPLQTRWAQSSPREQRWVRGALALLLLALVWWVALRPAIATLRTAQIQGPLLRAQLQDMLQLQSLAQSLQAQPAAASADGKGALEGALPLLGTNARMQFAGDRATVTLDGSSADGLAQWLAQTRLNAHARPLELHLTQNQGLWKGSIVLQVASPTAP
ncbi:MAG: type II secretion system protein GspM [Rhodoferax sp.]|nr:type II secretion system protein GspM [Rhodoferax sp.]